MRAVISAGGPTSGVACMFEIFGHVEATSNHSIRKLRLRTGHNGQNLLRIALLLLLFLVAFPSAFSQPFPVTSLVQTTRFSPFLEDYADPGRLIVTLISTDAREEYPALIRVRITGNNFQVRTRQDFLPSPVVLRRNQPLILTGVQLAPYFYPDNLEFTGLSPGSLPASGGALPEGPVTICVEVYDYQRYFDPPVSNTGCAQGLISLQPPPVLLEPVGEERASVPQQLRFVWQPQHAGVAAEYTLELYENLLPAFGYDAVLMSSAPLFSVRTFSTFYLYGAMEPTLISGQEYLVRVRAKDPAGQAAFRNNGWSEISAFTYTDQENCRGPQAPSWSPLSGTSALLAWSPPVGARHQWITADTNTVYAGGRNSLAVGIQLSADTGAYVLDSLENGSFYQFRICAECADGTINCTEIEFVFENGEMQDCTPGQPLNLMVTAVRPASADLVWSNPGNNIPDTFNIAWKTTANQAFGPEQTVYSDHFELTGLTPQTAYQARVCYRCPGGTVTCDSLELETPKSACTVGPVEYGFTCGDSADVAVPGDAPLLTAIAPGDTVWAGDYLVILKQVTGNGPFYGEGYIEVPYFNMAQLNVKLIGIEVNAYCRMSSGHMEMTGAGIGLIGTQWAGVLSDVLNTLSTLEDILGAAEDILSAISDILVEMGPSLPDSVTQNLQSAQAALAAAQQQYDAAVASGDAEAIAQAAQALQQAMDQVKAANQAFQAALDEIMTDLLGIVIQAIAGIVDSCPEQSGLESGFNNAVSGVDHYFQQRWSGLDALGGEGVGDFSILQQFISDTDADSTAFSAELVGLSDAYYEVEEQYLTCTAFGKLKLEVVDAAALTALAQVLLESGFNLVDFAGPLLQSGQPVEAIVAAVGVELKTRIGGVLVEMGY